MLTLQSLDTDLDFTFPEPAQKLSADQEAILKRFLQLCNVTADDPVVVWGTARMRRKPLP